MTHLRRLLRIAAYVIVTLAVAAFVAIAIVENCSHNQFTWEGVSK